MTAQGALNEARAIVEQYESDHDIPQEILDAIEGYTSYGFKYFNGREVTEEVVIRLRMTKKDDVRDNWRIASIGGDITGTKQRYLFPAEDISDLREEIASIDGTVEMKK